MIKMGILGGADIAYKMFMPALKKLNNIECIGVASNNEERRIKFFEGFDIPIFSTYDEIIGNPNIDAVYIPLPPALHYKWAKLALENKKHVFIEKPSTTDYILTEELVKLADKNDLALQENYMFQYHSQLKAIQNIIDSGKIGKVRLYKSSFGFPKRLEHDFRYSKNLGGGALMDAGGYVVKLAKLLLGDTIRVCGAQKQVDLDYEVDVFDSVMFSNDEGLAFQGSFGMDCHYQCELEIWGSKGKLSTDRIFTAPAGYTSTAVIESKEGQELVKLKPDIHFKNSIEEFCKAINDLHIRSEMKKDLLLQSKLVTEIKEMIEEAND